MEREAAENEVAAREGVSVMGVEMIDVAAPTNMDAVETVRSFLTGQSRRISVDAFSLAL